MSKLAPVYDEFMGLLDNAAFVTVDCELSGLTEDKAGITTIPDYLLLLRDGVTTYSLLQVGFCIAVYEKHEQKDKWALYPYNFYVYPNEDCIMHLRSTTIKWLKDHGFDFMKWIEEGLPYQRLDEANRRLRRTKRQKSVSRWGLQRLVKAVVESRKPVVVHNGLLDLFHVCDKFIAALPEEPQEIIRMIYEKLGPAIYDTKVVARYLQESGLHDMKGLFSLNWLYQSYDKRFKFYRSTRIIETACKLEYKAAASGATDGEEESFTKIDLNRLHEAGFDATVTAMVFTAEMILLQKVENISKQQMPKDSKEYATFITNNFKQVINRVNIHDQLGTEFLDFDRVEVET
ncbi:Target of EGR1 protein 1 [Babesia sp. Xinjiang]|uniref:Target of EGR1 protein 1 n=1 Tax=Babesia sp. Xinjiang TaxID=462227 RepID=UPI000A243EEE|nr:Target of EGR1 protein 1 [Babesia sp. Xinjiang]ORM40700.1 Target of EGR1 protein 1 [Babesia sp. Xinjiang]